MTPTITSALLPVPTWQPLNLWQTPCARPATRMGKPFTSRFRHFFQKMTDDKHMNPDDQPLNDTTTEHAAGEQDFTAVGATPEAGDSEGASRAETELADLKDKYLRLAAEFENYKRRTTKERTDLFKTANQELMVALLPVLDDFDRARKTLQQKGLAPMNAQGGDFDAELHEAITQIPAPSDDLRGKIVDEIEKGYYLGDKVIRHAKVVLGQ
jgi:molecular chaperone GrpE